MMQTSGHALFALAGLGAALVLAGCNTTQKSKRTCEDDVTELQVGIFEVSSYLEDLRPRIQDGYEALDDCNARTKTCDAVSWLRYAQDLRTTHRAARANFEVATSAFNPDACVAHIRNFQINPPRPDTYNGYFYTLEETSEQIDELISEFERRAK